MRIILFLALYLFFGTTLYSVGQPLSIQWQKCLGGTMGDAGYSIKQTIDGGYLSGNLAISNDGDVSGNHSNSIDFWVTKLNDGGVIDWQHCYGGSESEIPSSIRLLADGGFVFVGTTGSMDGDVTGIRFSADLWLINCDSTGSLRWEKALGGSEEDFGNDVIKGNDMGYMVLGIASSSDGDVIGRHDSSVCSTCGDVWLTKLDTVGAVLWSKCYGGYRHDIGYSMVATSDSGYIIAASARSDDGDVQGLHGAVAGHGNEDFWVLKIDSIGAIQWQRCFGGSESEVPNQIIRTKDGGYMVVGTAKSSDYDVTGYHYSGSLWDDVWILKLDSLGNMQWQKCMGGFDVDICRKVIQLEDSSYLALCYTYSTDGDLVANPPVGNIDVWLVRIDQAGNILWQQCLGGSNADAAYDFEQTSDGGIVFTGLTDSNDGDVSGNHGDFDVWVVKLGPLPDGIASSVNSITDFAVYQNLNCQTIDVSFYSNGNENVNAQLIDITGRTLLEQHLEITSGFNRQYVHTGNISAGVYLVRLLTDGGGVTKKLVVQ